MVLSFPTVEQSLHVFFLHDQNVAHTHAGSHGRSVVFHHHVQATHHHAEESHSANHTHHEHEHCFEQTLPLYLKAHQFDFSSLEKMLASTVFAVVYTTDLLDQSELNSVPYSHPPDVISCLCQQIIATHPNKAPPVA